MCIYTWVFYIFARQCLRLYYLQVPAIQYPDSVKCSALLDGHPGELSKAAEVLKSRPKVPIYEETYLEWTKDCKQFRQQRGYVEVRIGVNNYNALFGWSLRKKQPD